jgi:hypothetical protein
VRLDGRGAGARRRGRSCSSASFRVTSPGPGSPVAAGPGGRAGGLTSGVSGAASPGGTTVFRPAGTSWCWPDVGRLALAVGRLRGVLVRPSSCSATGSTGSVAVAADDPVLPCHAALSLDFLPGDGGDQVGVRHAQPGPVGVAGLVTGTVGLESEPIGVVLAVLRPQVREGMSAFQIQRAAEPLPAKPIRRFDRGALGVSKQPFVVRFREAEPVEARLDAVMITHAADAPLGELRGVAVPAITMSVSPSTLPSLESRGVAFRFPGMIAPPAASSKMRLVAGAVTDPSGVATPRLPPAPNPSAV